MQLRLQVSDSYRTSSPEIVAHQRLLPANIPHRAEYGESNEGILSENRFPVILSLIILG